MNAVEAAEHLLHVLKIYKTAGRKQSRYERETRQKVAIGCLVALCKDLMAKEAWTHREQQGRGDSHLPMGSKSSRSKRGAD
jgi:hypothetical protein